MLGTEYKIIIEISIHAPTRGATISNYMQIASRKISIHAPTRGATSTCEARYIISLYFNPRSYKRSDFLLHNSACPHVNFNPRSYKRSDTIDEEYGLIEIYISIHAPTRGATLLILKRIYILGNFNPRSYKRSDTSDTEKDLYTWEFQSTLLQEERLCIKQNYHDQPKFQSTLLQEERRSGSEVLHRHIYISIHAPTRGATDAALELNSIRVFQSTLLQEERQQKCTIFLMHLCNNYCIVSI